MDMSLDSRLVETASKVAVTRNEYGDTVYGASTSSACLYRDISTLNRAANREDITLDGYLWFAATEAVEKGDVYLHPDEGYLRIRRVTRAKKLLSDNTVAFIKCEVTKQRQIS